MGKTNITQSLLTCVDHVNNIHRVQRKPLACARLNEQGMSLIEVMVTMGIASTMMLGVLQLVSYANKSGKNIAVTSDWGSLVNSVQQAVNSDQYCQSMFQGMNFIGYQQKDNKGKAISSAGPIGGGAAKVIPPILQQFPLNSDTTNSSGLGQGVGILAEGSSLQLYDPTQVTAAKIKPIALATPKKKYPNFTLDEIKLEQTDTPQKITMVFPTDPLASNRKEYVFYLYPTLLTLAGTKIALTKTTQEEVLDPETGKPVIDPKTGKNKTQSVTKNVESLTLGSQQLKTQQGIQFSLITGPEENLDGTPVSAFDFAANTVTGVNPGPGIVFSCYGILMSSAKACRDMGGVYDNGKPEGQKCSISPLQLSGNFGPPGRQGLLQKSNGTKVLLSGNLASPSPTDFSIGIDHYDPKYYKLDQPSSPESFWFHLGGGTNRTEFSWNYSPPKLDSEASGWNLSPPADMILMRLKTKVVDPDPTTKSYVTNASKQIRNLELTIGPDLDARDNASDANWKSVNRWYSTLAFGGKPTTKESDPSNDNKYFSDTKIRSARANDLPNKNGLDFLTDGNERLQISSNGEVAIRDLKVLSVAMPDTVLIDDARISVGPTMNKDPLKNNSFIKPYYDALSNSFVPSTLSTDFSSFVQILRPALVKGVAQDDTLAMLNFKVGQRVPLQLGLNGHVAIGENYYGDSETVMRKVCDAKNVCFNKDLSGSTTAHESKLMLGGLTAGTLISSTQANSKIQDPTYQNDTLALTHPNPRGQADFNVGGLNFYTDEAVRMQISKNGKVVVWGDLEVKGNSNLSSLKSCTIYNSSSSFNYGSSQVKIACPSGTFLMNVGGSCSPEPSVSGGWRNTLMRALNSDATSGHVECMNTQGADAKKEHQVKAAISVMCCSNSNANFEIPTETATSCTGSGSSTDARICKP